MSGETQTEREDKSGVDGQRHPAHVRAYHRHFDGYSEVAVPKRDGKGTRIERVYTGDYYRQDLIQHRRILIRLLYVALFLCAVALFVSNAILPLASNSTWYVALPQAGSVAFLFWILAAFYFYLPAQRDMTIATYRGSSLSLLKATRGAAVCLGLVALANLSFLMLNPSLEHLAELLGTAKYVICALMTLGINQVEKRVAYVSVPSQNRPPEGSVGID